MLKNDKLLRWGLRIHRPLPAGLPPARIAPFPSAKDQTRPSLHRVSRGKALTPYVFTRYRFEDSRDTRYSVDKRSGRRRACLPQDRTGLARRNKRPCKSSRPKASPPQAAPRRRRDVDARRRGSGTRVPAERRPGRHSPSRAILDRSHVFRKSRLTRSRRASRVARTRGSSSITRTSSKNLSIAGLNPS